MRVALPQINKSKEHTPESLMFAEALKTAFEDAFYEGKNTHRLYEKRMSIVLFSAKSGEYYKHLDIMCGFAAINPKVIREAFKKYQNDKEEFFRMIKVVQEDHKNKPKGKKNDK
ncbi:hypothetical protein KAR91_63090 [Candidatus Pacearchaeota archaeon]|nr:hypothetical protein [Candidatus Pacearchaeota archaeon]